MVFTKVNIYFLILSLINTTCICYEDDELKQALGGGLSEGLDDLMNSFGEAIDGLAQMAEGKQIECEYKCENGRIQTPRKGHIPSSNGCGSFGIEIDTGKLPQMTMCCDTHDHCYDTCNSDKEKCDKDFKQCLLKMCNKLQDELNTEEYEGCQATAEIMYTGALALGCTPYKKAQKNACDCGDALELEHKPTDRKNKSGTKTSNTNKVQIPKTEEKVNRNHKPKAKDTENHNTNKNQKHKSQKKVKQTSSRESGEL